MRRESVKDILPKAGGKDKLVVPFGLAFFLLLGGSKLIQRSQPHPRSENFQIVESLSTPAAIN